MAETEIKLINNRTLCDTTAREEISKLKEDIDDLKENGVSGGSGEGLSEDVKGLILALAKNGVYENNTQVAIDQLENLFNGGSIGTYTVTYDLSNATSDNTSETTKAGLPFVASLTPYDDYALDVVTVLMNGEDVSLKVYSEGCINIPIVNGNVEITVTTKSTRDETLVYQLNEPMIFDGTSSYDTGYYVGTNNALENDYSILVDFVDNNPTEGVFIWKISENLRFGLTMQNNKRSLRAIGNQQYLDNFPTRVVVTHTSGENEFDCYCIINGEIKSHLNILTYYALNNAKNAQIKLGCSVESESKYLDGTINEFKVYNRVLTTDEIYNWLKGE